jgi:hypothetical protein
MNPVSLSELELVARAATPGPWVTPAHQLSIHEQKEPCTAVAFVMTKSGCCENHAANAAYIAAANPETILKLIAVARAAKDAYDFEKNTGFVARLNPLKEALAGLDGGGQ